MSLLLNNGTKPDGVEIKTFGFGTMQGIIYLGDYEISLSDFLCAAKYVLSNTDLEPNDPRLQFVKCIRETREIGGYNPSKMRLESTVPPVLS